MKQIILIFQILVLSGTAALGQIYNPVHWKTTYEHLGGDDFVIIHTAEIDEGWSVYSQYLESDEGPVPTSIGYDSQDHFELIGKSEESGGKKEGFDEIFEMNVTKYVDELVIKQKVTLKDRKKVSGYVNFMSCDATKCLPPSDHEFSLDLQPVRAQEKPNEEDGQAAAAANQGGILQPVIWTVEPDPNRHGLIARGKIQDGWHIYSHSIGPDDGPIPTEVYIGDESVALEEEGVEVVRAFDEIFEVELTKIKKGVTLHISLPKGTGSADGEIVYMACDKSRCIMPDPEKFTVDLSSGQLIGNASPTGEIPTGAGASLFGLDKSKLQAPIGVCDDTQVSIVESTGLWSIFTLGFIGGLLALLTPCVFPMIPLTVSFFTKGSENRQKGMRKAVLYGFFILLIYLLLSMPFHLMDSINPDILNDISTNVYLNLFFFVIFLVFAFSFFGFYEITIPSSWSNQASKAEGIGGVIGIFFMALTLALVSFSCTGPILGSLLAGALTSDGGATQLTAGMGGFGLALALPFAVFAAFPGLMGSIPKSGGWLNTVKVVLGFLELGLAFKFLSGADLVKRWGLLKIEPFLIIEIIIFAGLALYLFGKIKFPHDSPIKKLSLGRIGLGVVAAAFALYLASGFRVNQETNTFQSLTLLSGLAPPVGYSWLYPNKCPNNLDCFKDLNAGLTHARKVDKPVIIDFTGHACVNCRRMEEHVWPEKNVLDQLKNDYVLISLYVDEKIALPEAEQVTVPRHDGSTRKLRTVGNKWSYFQTEYFKTNAQPYYVLLSPEGELLNTPVGYIPDADEYAAFLSCGTENYQSNIGGDLLGGL